MINLKADIHDLLSALAPGTPLIFSDQNAPRPALPYWTIKITVQRDLGTDYYSDGVDALGDQEIHGVREATIQIQRIGTDSDFRMCELRDNLSKTTVLDKFRLKDISLYDKTEVLNIPFPLDGAQMEPRAAMDLFIRFGSKIIDRVGVIEVINVISTYQRPTNIDLSKNINIVL